MSKISRRKNREKQKELKKEIKKAQKKLRASINELPGKIAPRTQASNSKFSANSIEEEKQYREGVVSAQIQAWRSILPMLLNRFSKIKDPRNPNKIKHKITVLLMYALLSFVFRHSSRREANNNLSKPQLFNALCNIFPEFSTIPHVDTVYRLLGRIKPNNIEECNIALIKKLIRNKKFKNYLINGRYPISIDGTQKLVRNEFMTDEWLERNVKSADGTKPQQYIYIVEANLTFHNGLTIPIMSEFLFYDGNSNKEKQDYEINGFKRLAERLKKYFPQLNIIIFVDALFACETVVLLLIKLNWSFMIKLPKNKLKRINEILDENRRFMSPIESQLRYREREQRYYWKNNINFNADGSIQLNVVCCHEKYKHVSKETGNIETVQSEHRWLSNIKFNINNVHELCNLGARKRCLIEDSNNTEKNRGYNYEHLFSQNWNAMCCSHLLMRLAHAINAISEFTKKLKAYIKKNGVKIILDLIIETISNPWFDKEWFVHETKKPIRLIL